MEQIIKQLESALIEAENYNTKDSAMEYAYRYGMLSGAIKHAIFELTQIKK
jgi:hypothetical protein